MIEKFKVERKRLELNSSLYEPGKPTYADFTFCFGVSGGGAPICQWIVQGSTGFSTREGTDRKKRATVGSRTWPSHAGDLQISPVTIEPTFLMRWATGRAGLPK